MERRSIMVSIVFIGIIPQFHQVVVESSSLSLTRRTISRYIKRISWDTDPSPVHTDNSIRVQLITDPLPTIGPPKQKSLMERLGDFANGSTTLYVLSYTTTPRRVPRRLRSFKGLSVRTDLHRTCHEQKARVSSCANPTTNVSQRSDSAEREGAERPKARKGPAIENASRTSSAATSAAATKI